MGAMYAELQQFEIIGDQSITIMYIQFLTRGQLPPAGRIQLRVSVDINKLTKTHYVLD